MIQILRAYFMLHVVTIKWMMCVQEKIENIVRKFPGVTKTWHCVVEGWHLPPRGYGPGNHSYPHRKQGS